VLALQGVGGRSPAMAPLLSGDLAVELGAVPLAYGAACAMAYATLRALSGALVPGWASLDARSRANWWNRGTSALNAVVIFGSAVLYVAWDNPALVMRESMSDFEKTAIDMMIGYMLYDTVIELLDSSDPFALVHHTLGLVAHVVARVNNSGASGLCIMLVFLAESSTPLLHAGWLMNKLGKTDNAAFKLMGATLLLLFFVFRVVLGPFVMGILIVRRDAWRESWENALMLVVMSGFTMLNWHWFHKLVSVVLSAGKPAGKKD